MNHVIVHHIVALILAVLTWYPVGIMLRGSRDRT
jgi:hypothetical protein